MIWGRRTDSLASRGIYIHISINGKVVYLPFRSGLWKRLEHVFTTREGVCRVAVDRVEVARLVPRVGHIVDGGRDAAEIFVADQLEVVFLPGEIHVIDDTSPVSSPLFVEVATEIFDSVLIVLQLLELVAKFFAESGDCLADGAQLVVRRARASAQDGRDDGKDGVVFRHFGGHVGGRMGHDGSVETSRSRDTQDMQKSTFR